MYFQKITNHKFIYLTFARKLLVDHLCCSQIWSDSRPPEEFCPVISTFSTMLPNGKVVSTSSTVNSPVKQEIQAGHVNDKII